MPLLWYIIICWHAPRAVDDGDRKAWAQRSSIINTCSNNVHTIDILANDFLWRVHTCLALIHFNWWYIGYKPRIYMYNYITRQQYNVISGSISTSIFTCSAHACMNANATSVVGPTIITFFSLSRLNKYRIQVVFFCLANSAKLTPDNVKSAGSLITSRFWLSSMTP